MTEVLLEGLKAIHFDPITFLAVVIGLVFINMYIRKEVIDQGSWIKNHENWIASHETDARRQWDVTNQVLTEMKEVQARVVAITETHDQRIERLEKQQDSLLIGRA